MKKQKSGLLIKIGLLFGGGYIALIFLVLLMCGTGSTGEVGGIPIMVTEDQAYEYQYICAEAGVPWDIPLLADIMLADQNGQTKLKDIDPIFNTLQFCVVTERRMVSDWIPTGEKTQDGEDVLREEWFEVAKVQYSGLHEILEYMDVDASWLTGKDMTAVLERFGKICDSKKITQGPNKIKYTTSIAVNENLEYVLLNYIGLSEKKCEDVMNLHSVQYMAQLYGYMYVYGDVALPELVVGQVSRADLANVAVSLIGHPYLLGGKSPAQGVPQGPLDCSGFVDWVYIQCFGTGVSGGGVPEGVAVSGTAMQWYASSPIDESALKVGDLAFMYDPAQLASGKVNHVGIYIGSVNGTKYFIHCAGRSYGTTASPSGRVGISTLSGGTNSYNCVTGGTFEPGMKSCKFKYFRRPNFSFLYD